MFEIKYKHYIKINEQNEIISVFSDAFQVPEETDILLYETEERHCKFQVFSEKYPGKYKYKYIDGKIVEKTEEELYTPEERKADKIKQIKAEAERKILKIYPLWKQINLIAEYNKYKDTEEKKKEMINYINNIRNIVDNLEIKINNCYTKEEINNININI